MKFKNYLTDIENVSIYPLISLIIFTMVFAAVLFYVFSSDKNKMNDNANIPLK